MMSEGPVREEGTHSGEDERMSSADADEETSEDERSSPSSSVEDSGESCVEKPNPSGPMQAKEKEDVEMFDRYGFLTVETPQGKGEREEVSLSKVKTPVRTEKKERAAIAREMARAEKWIRMMKDWDMASPKFHLKLKRRTRKGIPDSVRGKAWGMMAGINERRKTDRKMYTRLLSREECPCESIIERDLARTFPRHEWFRKKGSGGQQALHNVLRAFSLYDVSVGYCQGMGFIAALLLSYMSEEDAFWMLVCLMEKYDMKRLFLPHFPMLQECFFVYEELLKKRLPKLYDHLEKEQVHPSMYASQWFLTLFVYQFPFPVILRIWDIFVLEGWKVVFRVSIAVMRLLEKDLLARSFEYLITHLKSETETLDEKVVMKALFQVRLTHKQVKELQDRHKAIVKEAEELRGL